MRSSPPEVSTNYEVLNHIRVSVLILYVAAGNLWACREKGTRNELRNHSYQPAI
jgi:hypothetical protein